MIHIPVEVAGPGMLGALLVIVPVQKPLQQVIEVDSLLLEKGYHLAQAVRQLVAVRIQQSDEASFST